MKIEKIELNDDNCCCMEDRVWISETQEYEKVTHTGQGYRVGYQIFCEDCIKSMQEAVKIFDGNKKIKAIEI